MKQYAFIQLIAFLQRMFPVQFKELAAIAEDWHEEGFPDIDEHNNAIYITRAQFLRLPIEMRREIMEGQAEELAATYKEESDGTD